MSLMRFFAEHLTDNGEITICGEDAHHLLVVARAKPGERIAVCDGGGTEAECELVSAEGKTAVVRVLEKYKSRGEPGVEISLYPSVSKGERFEWTLQKAVELGAASITPVMSARCVAGIPDQKKLQRWRRIAREAARQSGRGIIPKVWDPIGFEKALTMAQGSRIFCHEEERALSLSGFFKSSPPFEAISVMTGPEGGYAPEEASAAVERGWTPVSLGSRILRCETAPPAVLAAILALSGEM